MSAPIAPRVSRAEALATRLEADISADSLQPGQRLGTKRELRERFGVAAGTFNEAMRIMVIRGVVDARPGPGGGVFVARRPERTILNLDWSRSTLGDCAELRAVLEPVVSRKAALAASPADIAALTGLVDQMAAATGEQAYLRANWRFHERVARLVESVPLRSVYLTLIDVLARGLDDFAFEDDGADAIAVHRELVAAIEAGDDERIDRAVAAHMARSPLSATLGSARRPPPG